MLHNYKCQDIYIVIQTSNPEYELCDKIKVPETLYQNIYKSEIYM